MDDTIRPGVTMESLAALKPVFPDWGENTTTAGNASGIGDGAALCILTTREKARAEGMEILAKWVGCAVVGMLLQGLVYLPLQPERSPRCRTKVHGCWPHCSYSQSFIPMWPVERRRRRLRGAKSPYPTLSGAHCSICADKRSVCFPVRLLCGRAWNSNKQDQPKV